MLAMGVATSCSDNESFEAVVDQPQEGNIVTLSADIAMPTTRATIEGVEGTENAFNFTGWRDGETLIGVYGDPTWTLPNGLGLVEFKYSEKNGKFSASLPQGVTIEDIFTVHTPSFSFAPSWYSSSNSYGFSLYLPTTVEVSKEEGWADFPLFSRVSVVGDELCAKMDLPNIALACVTNNSDKEIAISRFYDEYNGNRFNYELFGYYVSSSYLSNDMQNGRNAESIRIAPKSKVYIPMSTSYASGLKTSNGTEIRPATWLQAGMVYSVNIDNLVDVSCTDGGVVTLTDLEGNPVTTTLFEKGTKLVATAEATKEGSLFAGWVNEKGEIVSTKSVYEFEADGYVVLRAIFEGWEKFATGEFGIGLSDVKPASGAVMYRSYSDPTLYKLVGHELFSDGFLFTMSSDFSNIRTLKQDITPASSGPLPAAYLLTANSIDELGDDDEVAAAQWFRDNYVAKGKGIFITMDELHLIDIKNISCLWIQCDRQDGMEPGVKNLPDGLAEASLHTALHKYLQDGGNLFLTKHATQLATAIGRIDEKYAPGIYSSGVGGEGGDVWTTNAQIGIGGPNLYDHRTHPIFAGMETGDPNGYGFESFPLQGPGMREDHNCMWDCNAYRFSGQPNVIVNFEDATSSSVLSTWGHVQDYCCAGIVEFMPNSEFAGRIIAIGLSAYEFNQAGGNSYQGNIEKLTANCIDYLVGPTFSHVYADEGRGAYYGSEIIFTLEYVNQDGLVKEANPYFLFDMKNPIDNIGIKDGIWQDEEDL